MPNTTMMVHCIACVCVCGFIWPKLLSRLLQLLLSKWSTVQCYFCIFRFQCLLVQSRTLFCSTYTTYEIYVFQNNETNIFHIWEMNFVLISYSLKFIVSVSSLWNVSLNVIIISILKMDIVVSSILIQIFHLIRVHRQPSVCPSIVFVLCQSRTSTS